MMKKESGQKGGTAGTNGLVNCFPDKVLRALVKVARGHGVGIYLVGGTVRDWLLGGLPHDLDLAVDHSAEKICRELAAVLGGTYVQLGTADEEAARVVVDGLDIDISAFRGGAATIEEDLARRDYTVNSLAVDLEQAAGNRGGLIDPLDGLGDLERGCLRHCPGAFVDDPLRMVRGYRFMATLGFSLAEATRDEIRLNNGLITGVAAERIRYELDVIMAAAKSANALWEMHSDGLLEHLIPELYDGVGVEQPDFHHLDVFLHNFQALREMEALLAEPASVYPQREEAVVGYVSESGNSRRLKWAALLHDLGKPATRKEGRGAEERVTFYGHDELGRQQFEAMARRLRWSNEDRERTGGLIAMHMHPFHLCNVRREQPLSRRAALKLCRRAGADMPGLFLLAMADSMASMGELKPEEMEAELVGLYKEVSEIEQEHIAPLLAGPPLLGGRDLIDSIGLTPGPVFSEILDELQMLQVEGRVITREDALSWVKRYVKERNI